MRTYKQGFTLIELLVAISIIIVLATIIFVALGNARNKGKGARIQTETVQLRTHIEYGYTGLKYNDLANGVAGGGAGQDTLLLANWVTSGAALRLLKDDITTGQGGGLKIYESGTALNTITVYAIYVYYPGSVGGYCLDSTGANHSYSTNTGAFTSGSDATACPTLTSAVL